MNESKSQMPETAIFRIGSDFSDNSGESKITFEINKEFKSWFKKINQMNRWSEKRLVKAIEESIKKHKESRGKKLQKVSILIEVVDA